MGTNHRGPPTAPCHDVTQRLVLVWLTFDRGQSRDEHESPGAADGPSPKPDGAIKNVTRGDHRDRLRALLSQ